MLLNFREGSEGEKFVYWKVKIWSCDFEWIFDGIFKKVKSELIWCKCWWKVDW